MAWETIVVLGLIAVMVVLFLRETFSPDQVALGGFALLLILSVIAGSELLPSPEALFQVFANPAPLTVGAMFVISRALEKSGAMEVVAENLKKLTSLGYPAFLFLLVLLIGLFSAFVNNTPVVVVFVPVVLTVARSLGVSASKLLIPISYAAVSGGLCTLLGTSTNLVVSGLLSKSGHPPLGMFELTALGIPLLLVTGLYLVLAAPKLLPDRSSLTSILSDEERREYLTEAFIRNNSPLAGQTLLQSGLLKKRGLRVLEIIRDGVALTQDYKHEPLVPGDRLVLACRPSGFASVRSMAGIDLAAEASLGIETISAYEGTIMEGVIGPKSSLVGKTVRMINFRQRFRVILLAIHRNGQNLREKADSTPLQFGDILLLMGPDSAREELRRSEDILLLDRPATPALDRLSRIPVVVGVIFAVILLSSLDWVPIHVASLLACAILTLSRCLSMKEAYESIEWSVLMMIFCMIGIGQAMQTSGAATFLVDLSIHAAEWLIPKEYLPLVMLAVLYLVTMVLTEFLSNNATAVLMIPIALGVALQLGMDARPYAIAVCIASSAAFATPIGYQTNTYVYGVGNYHFHDFLKIGLPLNFLCFVTCMLLIPRIWPFE